MAEATVVAAVGWVVSPLIRKLADKPPSYFGGDVSTDKLHELKTITLPKIETVIEAAGTIPIGRLEPWLNDLKAAALEAEDVLDEYDYKLLKEKVSPLSSASLFSVAESSKKIASKAKGRLSPLLPKTKLAKSVEKLEKTAARVDEFIEILKLKINPDLADGSTSAASVVANTQEVIVTTSTPPLAVVGRDGECDDIVHLLTSSAADAPESSGSSSKVVVGRDGECDDIVHLSTSSAADAPESSGSSSKVPVIAIQGIGGAGKTTLAQKIYNDSRVVKYFQPNRMWVHVPRKFDPSRVAKEMMESLTGEPTGNMLNLDALLNKLKENLKDKKFLLVLDDVWDEPKGKMQYRWDQLVGALNAVAVRGSRILMTTRMEGVALMLGAKPCIALKELKSEDCLSIVEHYAFNGGFKFADFPEELREVGKQIVNRLKGSPLAARVVASNQLRRKCTVDAWRRILEVDLLNTSTMLEGMESVIRDALLSSFKHLPPHLQRCFSYCSLFSEGEKMEHDELINLWIAEGFVDVPEKNGSRAEDVGSRYCDELEYYSFFQRRYYNSYFIHDLLHDLAEYVSNGICYRIDGDDEPKEIPLTVLHLSITKASLGIHVPNICKLVSLRTLRVYHDSETESADFAKMFKKLKRLRVLDLRYNKGVSELPSCVGHLKHLRYLDLSSIERLPQSFSRLYHLQLLNLPYSRINSLPEGMNSLISLRHLSAGSDLVCSIPEIGKLTSLQTLWEYRISKDRRYGIGQLNNMRELRGSLCIKKLENVKDKAEASKAMLKEKKHLDKLVFEWDDSDNNRDGRSDEEVLEALAPYCLKELEIRGYKGARTPSWMLRNRSQCLSNLQCLQLYHCSNWELGAIEPPSYLKKLKIHTSDSLRYPSWMSESQCLSHLEELHLSGCSKWEVLPPLGRLPMLRVLTILNATGVRQIGPEFYGMDGGNSGFPRLEKLFWQGMESCEQLTGGVQACPSLPVLNIENWPELKQVSYLPHNLRELCIGRCPKLTEISLFPLLSKEELKTTLEVVSIYECENLRSVEGLGALPSLKRLTISSCSRLLLTMSEAAAADAAPQQPLLPSSLQALSLRKCDGVHRLPPGFLLGLTSLTHLSICNCADLQSLGDDLSCLTSLEDLFVGQCPKLAEGAPDGRRFRSVKTTLNIQNATGVRQIGPEFYGMDGGNSGFPRLEKLFWQGMESCEQLTGGVQAFPSLRVLNIENWPELKQVSYLPHNLRELYIRRCPKLTEISLFPLLSKEELKIAVEEVYIYECENLRSVEGLGALPSLERLKISSCSRLLLTMSEAAAADAAPQQPLLPSSLQHLSLENCDGVHRLPPGFLLGLTSLTELSICNCADLQSLGDDLSCLTSLEYLSVRQCPKLEGGAHDGRRFPSVKRSLYIDDPSLLGLLEEQALASLERLGISDCPEDITGFTPEQEEMLLRLTSLEALMFRGCKNLRSLPDNLESLSSLTALWIMSCPKMETLPNRLPTSLESLDTYECHPQLCEQYGDGGPQRYKIRHYPDSMRGEDSLREFILYHLRI